MGSRWHTSTGRWLLWLVGVLPLGFLFWQGWRGGFGPDPGEYLSGFTGEWAIWFLLLSLSVTPLRRLAGWGWLLPYRQVLGLLSWAYAGLHVLVYLALWLGWQWGDFPADVQKRPYLLVGLLAYVLMWPLALTSSRRATRWLGVLWKRIHRLVYAIVILAVIHVFWQSKAGLGEALAYVLCALVLLVSRCRPGPSRARPPAP
ncbi:MAG: sulfoxide reductase heme-binding subunit YedZ [Gammaproteobacteria bacterium]|nr:MAG: sulfoxide reductase heme-binding subunit YedZ [Gammaproteobacteria bacterium]